jgi:CHAD domain-containing protein
MQIFGPTPPALAEMLATLKAAQDHLGRLHDVFYAAQLIGGLLPPSSPRTRDQATPHQQTQDYLEALAREGEQLRSSIGPLWQRLTGLPMRQIICDFIASL